MNARPPVVFVVDDDVSVRRAMLRLLRMEGFAVETFESGPQFLDACDECRRGCAILDVKMPGMSGFEVLEVLAARGSTLPVILITGHGEVSMGTRAMLVGCVGFLMKPFEDEALLDAVRDALHGQAAADPCPDYS